MTLPLIRRAKEDGITFLLTPKTKTSGLHQITALAPAPRIPLTPPAPGEQYRFHFDMTKCIGCKCCVVACNEQNGNPAAINWRRVGEIEGGWYPYTHRLYLSMGCNHCVEPSCLIGCPTEAFTKDSATGIVQHDANMCIGCQYCTWNCSYGVPQYNAARGVVGKCDMCYGRLSKGQEPACVFACPEGAITIETVDIAAWKMEYELTANAPGLPSASDSLSTTRITLPDRLPPDTARVDGYNVKPEPPHWPLVFMLVLTQLSVGAFATIWLLHVLHAKAHLHLGAVAAFVVGALALGASVLHLGRPVYAWRAAKMWKRSWLSREVLVFTLFAVVASGYAALLWQASPAGALLGALTSAFGLLGVTCSAFIYLVPARPAWNSRRTIAEFHLTGAILGPLFVAAAGVTANPSLLRFAACAAALQIVNQAFKFFDMIRAERCEMQASAKLLSSTLKNQVLLRATLLVAGVMIPLLVRNAAGAALGLVFALTAEILGRYLFFVSVVPKNMASAYHVSEAA
ncbi:MAG: dimethyl sulfoxide reductase anchor subunit [Acidobacteriia bacterium]|nr:dimethyl sulfoxide reductase anchor subunit [Terriglobia bacterium]